MTSDLEALIADQMQNPVFAGAYRDAIHRGDLLGALTDHRRTLGLTRAETAVRMEVPLDAVEDYEHGRRDPTLSFHQRYARALGLQLTVSITDPEGAS